MSDTPSIFTIGYSTHEWDAFARLLRQHRVTLLADVRSHPYSRLESYRRENLEANLPALGVAYQFLGRELGARRTEAECFVDGQADYDKVARLPAFLSGIQRLGRHCAVETVALMCAEKEPLDCHRTVLIARALVARDWRVRHILATGAVEDHSETELRLVQRMGTDPLFDGELSEEALVERAYAERGRQMAYRVD